MKLSERNIEKIFNHLYLHLRLFANKYVHNLKDAEDIVQNVFIKVWEDKIVFQDKNKIEGFFYIAVKNKSLDFLRSKYKKDVKTYTSEALEILQTERYYIKQIVLVNILDKLDIIINSLPRQQKNVILLNLEGYKNKEIADKMKISLSTVKDHKKTIYNKIREKLTIVNN